MPGIGDTLREARMRQGLDIADVETKTKIRAKYLRALENEEFSMLPGATFVRTFLRTYAEQLGLDPHRLVEEYRASYEPREDPDSASLGRPVAMRDRDRRGRGGGPRVGRGGPPVGPGAPIGPVGVAGNALLVGVRGTGHQEPPNNAAKNHTPPPAKN